MWGSRNPYAMLVSMWTYTDILQSQAEKCPATPAYMSEWHKSTRGHRWGYSSQYCLWRWEARSWLSVHCWGDRYIAGGRCTLWNSLQEQKQWTSYKHRCMVNPINREGRNIVTCSTKPLMHFNNTCTKNYTDTHKWMHVKLVKLQ